MDSSINTAYPTLSNPEEDPPNDTRMSLGKMNQSFMSSQNFSLSSIISDFSKLLDANSESSFLIHVDDVHSSTLLKPNDDPPILSSVDPETQFEVLRRMSVIDSRCSRSAFVRSFSNSELHMEKPEESFDSWDEFDKVMERSLPAKELELHEFEELSQKKNHSRVKIKSEGFISAEDAKVMMDKEEEDRAQFCKSNNTSFLTGGRATPSIILDPLSVTKYFRGRSSFPFLDNCANDSTMFMDNETFADEKTLRGIETDLDTEPTQLQRSAVTQDRPLEEVITPQSKEITEYLTSSQSDGANASAIVAYILKACKEAKSGQVETHQPELSFSSKSILNEYYKEHPPTLLNGTKTPTKIPTTRRTLVITPNSSPHTQNGSGMKRKASVSFSKILPKKLDPPSRSESIAEKPAKVQTKIIQFANTSTPSLKTNLTKTTDFLKSPSHPKIQRNYSPAAPTTQNIAKLPAKKAHTSFTFRTSPPKTQDILSVSSETKIQAIPPPAPRPEIQVIPSAPATQSISTTPVRSHASLPRSTATAQTQSTPSLSQQAAVVQSHASLPAPVNYNNNPSMGPGSNSNHGGGYPPQQGYSFPVTIHIHLPPFQTPYPPPNPPTQFGG